MDSLNGSEVELLSTSAAWSEIESGHDRTQDTQNYDLNGRRMTEGGPVKVTPGAHILTDEARGDMVVDHNPTSTTNDTGAVPPEVKQEPQDEEGISFPLHQSAMIIPSREPDESHTDQGKAQPARETGTVSSQEAPPVQLVPNGTVEPLPDINTHKQPSARNATSLSSAGKKRKRHQPKANAASKKKKGKTLAKNINRLKGHVSAQDTINGFFRRDPDATSGNNSSNDKADKSAVKAATNYFQKMCEIVGTEKGLPNNLYSVAGMKTALRDYQLVGAAFMMRLERGEREPHGGIIADEMGLGKTVQAIACILLHQPSTNAKTEGRGSTLIVVPSEQLIRQWITEFRKHIVEGTVDPPYHYRGRSEVPAVGLKHLPIL